MFPAFLITFREIIEASLVVTTVVGILVKLRQTKGIKTVWIAAILAFLSSVLLVSLGSFMGIGMRDLYEQHEALVEGSLMVVSAVFITWAVFFLHRYFGEHKARFMQKIRDSIEREEQRGLFLLVFTAVFREGIEITLFLTTIYFSSTPQSILTGFSFGAIAALLVVFGFFSATVRLPVVYAFRTTSIFLILFAAGLLARSVGEFTEVGIIPQIWKMTLPFLPSSTTFLGDILQAIFGISKKMDIAQLALYGLYVTVMSWWVFRRE